MSGSGASSLPNLGFLDGGGGGDAQGSSSNSKFERSFKTSGVKNNVPVTVVC